MLLHWRIAEEHKRCFLELNRDLGMALGEALACSYIERHTYPSPIIYVEFEGHKSLGPRLGSNTRLRSISRKAFLAQEAVCILSANATLKDLFRCQRLHGMQHLGLLVAYRIS